MTDRIQFGDGSEAKLVQRNGQTWLKSLVLVVLIPALVAGAGLVVMHAQLDDVRTNMDKKANSEVVSVMNEAILRELQSINRRLERMEAR